MFSKYKKGGSSGQKSGQPELKPIDGGNSEKKGEVVPKASRRQQSKPLAAAQAAPVDKEKKRKERLGEIKLELHKRLLDNLNLSALETASVSESRGCAWATLATPARWAREPGWTPIAGPTSWT